jgi:hypothetical protein
MGYKQEWKCVFIELHAFSKYILCNSAHLTGPVCLKQMQIIANLIALHTCILFTLHGARNVFFFVVFP